MTITVHESPATLGEAVAARIFAGIRAAAAAGRRYLLGCPGGRTPQTTYAALGRLVAAAGQDLAHVVIVMMDEYLVPDPAGRLAACPATAHYSCHRCAHEAIARQVPAGEVWLPDPADPAAYDRQLTAAGGIDLFLIAAGASDGHVGFNGPCTAVDSLTRVIELAETTRRDNLATFPEFHGRLGDVPRHGVSVGLGTIARQSREVLLLLHGTGKQEALRRLAACRDFDPAWPASIIYRCRQPALVLDAAVAAALPPGFAP